MIYEWTMHVYLCIYGQFNMLAISNIYDAASFYTDAAMLSIYNIYIYTYLYTHFKWIKSITII